MRTKKLAQAAVGAVLMGTALAASPTAMAAGGNGVCETGEFCLYYNSDHTGSMVDLGGGRKDYGTGTGCVKFVGAGSGRGQCIKNNVASVWNREASVVTVFYKSNWAGSVDAIGSGSKVNLNGNLKNQNAGHVVGKVGNDTFGQGVYHASGGRITAYFDGYLNTSGRHEGVDVAKGVGVNVFAMLGGVVTRVTEGAAGSGGLSQIAIYNATLDRTVVYLHTNPLDGVDVGDTISKGERIATESWRGISSAGGAHTHVEMRVGRQTSAARSVGDFTLSNPVPTQFWMDRGYNVCCD